MITLTREQQGNFQLSNEAGFTINGVTSQDSENGLTPFQLISSSLSLCMALSLDALINRDELDVDRYTISVKPQKAEDSPSRIEKFTIEVDVIGSVDDKVKQKLVKLAKRACTVGNTIERGATVDVSVK
ncbi:OsmC family protein [Aquibacillus salsiterrae]|uniref:OsmC family protein n=1 Tax=Aquibacillus salsiterrae TaxID=2950439 RepID=A0A9X4AEK1_9BACI|nr:OsmC family protein [Aquibacillus salsiterrae]MDC3416891.1 OsmC family protein [Aquibacillus salsiterrae]